MRTLFLDIETSPMTGYSWDLWKEQGSADFITEDWYILCWCAKCLETGEKYFASLPDYNDYKQNKTNDKKLMLDLHKVMQNVDIVVTQNGIKFDLPKINTRFLKHGIKPVKPFKNVDTLLIAKKFFAFSSNKLDYMGKFLGIGKKVATGGFSLWKGCINGDQRCWDKMVKYCMNDVLLLEKLYKRMLPYMNSHPNKNYYSDEKKSCPKCGSKNLVKQGYSFQSTGKKQQYQCKKCGGWCLSGKVIKNS